MICETLLQVFTDAFVQVLVIELAKDLDGRVWIADTAMDFHDGQRFLGRIKFRTGLKYIGAHIELKLRR